MNAKRGTPADMTDDDRFDFSPEDLKRVETRWKSDVDLKLDRIDRRVGIIERLVWIAVGGTAVIASITLIGVGIVIKQGEKIDNVAMRQSGVIMQADAIHKSQQDQIDRLRQGITK